MTIARKGTLLKGYFIQVYRDLPNEEDLNRQLVERIMGSMTGPFYAAGRAWPQEWKDIGQDPTVTKAVLFSSTDRHRPARKRRILASYTRQAAGVAA